MKVLVIGAGIIGAACARSLARRGVDVTVLDRGPAVGATSSAGEGNLLVSDKSPGPELALANYSLDLWRRLPAALAEELDDFASIEYDPKGGLVVATNPEEAAGLAELAGAQRAAGVQARTVSLAEAHELEPYVTPLMASAVYYPDDAQVQPVIAAEALLASARAAGARVLVDTAVTGPFHDAAGQLVGVTTNRGTLEADHVVVAAGPWSGEVATQLGGTLDVRPRKGWLLVTTPMAHRITHKVYDASYVGAVQSDDGARQVATVIESTASGTVLIGSSREDVGFDSRVDAAAWGAIAARAVRLMPALRDAAIMRAYCGFRPFSRDHLPVIGPDRDVAGLWYATGHEGAGIGLAPGTAELVSALLLGEPTAIATEPFSSFRPTLTKVA